MGFTIGFGLGWLWGILSTVGAIGVVCAVKDSREKRRRPWPGVRRNDKRILDAVREVTRDRQDVAWRN